MTFNHPQAVSKAAMFCLPLMPIRQNMPIK
jgi:hypothetical protein